MVLFADVVVVYAIEVIYDSSRSIGVYISCIPTGFFIADPI